MECQLSLRFSFHKTQIILWACALIAFSFHLSAFAEQQVSQSTRFAEVKRAYLEAAFGDGNLSLIKFETDGNIRSTYICNPRDRQKCAAFANTVNSSIRSAGSLRVEFGQDKAPFEIIASGAMNLEGYRVVYSKRFSGKMIDASDIECQLYYDLDTARNSITRASLIVSFNATPTKIRFCLISQFRRAVGLSNKPFDSFSEIWNADPALAGASDQLLDKAVHSYTLLELIHMCPDLKPGMTVQAVDAELIPSSPCFDPIEKL